MAINKILHSWWFGCTLAVISIAYVIVKLVPLFGPQMIDFVVYLRAAQSVVARTNPYLPSENVAADMSFLYPPGSLLFFLPFNLVGPVVASVIVSVLSILLIFGSVYFILKIVSKKSTINEWLCISAFVLQTFPVKLGLALGQINCIVLFFITFSFFLYKKKQLDWAGFLLGIAAVLKLYPLALIPLMLLKKQWRLLGIFLGTFLMFNLLFPELFSYYFLHELPNVLHAAPASLPSFYDQSIPALLYRFFLSKEIVSYLQTPITFCIIALTIWKIRKEPFIEGSFILLAISVLLHLPAWQHQLVLCYPALFLLYPKKQMFLIWLLLTFHYPSESIFLQTYPLFAAVHTVLILFCLICILYRYQYKQALNAPNAI